MYERFTDRTRMVIQLANQEAQSFNHKFIGAEHILIGLAEGGTGVAETVLKNLGLDLRIIRIEVEKSFKSRPDAVGLLRQNKVIEYATEESQSLRNNYIGTEHLLLGLFREPECIAVQILKNLGIQEGNVRAEIQRLHSQPNG